MQNKGEIVFYQTQDGETKLSVNLQDETVWLSLDQMAELFQRDKSTISRHIKNSFQVIRCTIWRTTTPLKDTLPSKMSSLPTLWKTASKQICY